MSVEISTPTVRTKFRQKCLTTTTSNILEGSYIKKKERNLEKPNYVHYSNSTAIERNGFRQVCRKSKLPQKIRNFSYSSAGKRAS
jgi:hypothetical protein